MLALILSDVHANEEALRAVLAAAGPHDLLWNLGDAVGYGASPNEVLDILRPLTEVHVRGNHDRVCSGLDSTLHFNPTAQAAAEWTFHALAPEHLAWLRALPGGSLHPIEEVICAHGSPLDEDHYIIDLDDAEEPLRQMTAPIAFFGHTHVQGGFLECGDEWQHVHPYYRSMDGPDSWTMPLIPGARYLINPGSVGQPRDRDWRAAFALYDSAAATITFHRIPYDIRTAQRRILEAGLPPRLATRLADGC